MTWGGGSSQALAGLRDSIDYAYAHVDEALEYAMRYGRGIDKETCRKFVLMYVNDYTKRLGPDGKAALERLYALAHSKKLIPTLPRRPDLKCSLSPRGEAKVRGRQRPGAINRP